MTLVQVLSDHGLNLLALFVSSNVRKLLFIVEDNDGVLVLDDLLVEVF